MNITMWQIYWITRLDDIGIAIGILTIFLGITSVILLAGSVGFPDNNPGWYPEKAKYFYRVSLFFLGTLFINTMIPSTKDMAAILVIPKIVNNKQVQKFPSQIMDLATEWMAALKPTAK